MKWVILTKHAPLPADAEKAKEETNRLYSLQPNTALAQALKYTIVARIKAKEGEVRALKILEKEEQTLRTQYINWGWQEPQKEYALRNVGKQAQVRIVIDTKGLDKALALAKHVNATVPPAYWLEATPRLQQAVRSNDASASEIEKAAVALAIAYTTQTVYKRELKQYNAKRKFLDPGEGLQTVDLISVERDLKMKYRLKKTADRIAVPDNDYPTLEEFPALWDAISGALENKESIHLVRSGTVGNACYALGKVVRKVPRIQALLVRFAETYLDDKVQENSNQNALCKAASKANNLMKNFQAALPPLTEEKWSLTVDALTQAAVRACSKLDSHVRPFVYSCLKLHREEKWLPSSTEKNDYLENLDKVCNQLTEEIMPSAEAALAAAEELSEHLHHCPILHSVTVLAEDHKEHHYREIKNLQSEEMLPRGISELGRLEPWDRKDSRCTWALEQAAQDIKRKLAEAHALVNDTYADYHKKADGGYQASSHESEMQEAAVEAWLKTIALITSTDKYLYTSKWGSTLSAYLQATEGACHMVRDTVDEINGPQSDVLMPETLTDYTQYLGKDEALRRSKVLLETFEPSARRALLTVMALIKHLQLLRSSKDEDAVAIVRNSKLVALSEKLESEEESEEEEEEEEEEEDTDVSEAEEAEEEETQKRRALDHSPEMYARQKRQNTYASYK